MNRFVVISGCSGGGKSTLLAELAARGHAVVAEPGRRIVAHARAAGGKALPWVDLAAFARAAMRMALADRQAAAGLAGWVFFDRGLIDAAVALQHATGAPALDGLRHDHRYHGRVFLTPPWPQIYVADAERRHDFAAAAAEYDRLCAAYKALGYTCDILPRIDVAGRADHVLRALGA